MDPRYLSAPRRRLSRFLKTMADISALMSRRIGIIQEMLRLAVAKATAAPVRERLEKSKTQPLRIEPHRVTDFGRLVRQMEANNEPV